MSMTRRGFIGLCVIAAAALLEGEDDDDDGTL